MKSIDWKDFGLQTLRLLPFFILVALYFSLVRDDSNVILSTCLICAPIIGLMLFILVKGTQCTAKFKQSQFILVGLAFSCVGNLFINIDLFTVGLAFFAVVHILYSVAFEFEGECNTWNSVIFLVFFCTAATMYMNILHHLDLALKIEIPFYALFLSTMCWSGIMCAIKKRTVFASLSAVGAVFFFTAALLISLCFYRSFTSIPRMYIVATYYAGQFLIALGTLSETKTVSIQLTAE